LATTNRTHGNKGSSQAATVMAIKAKKKKKKVRDVMQCFESAFSIMKSGATCVMGVHQVFKSAVLKVKSEVNKVKAISIMILRYTL
jgi:hypothetical protein